MLSTTVTVDVHVDTLPLASVTVNVTVFAPVFVQSNALGLTLIVYEQLSLDPLLI